MFAILGEIPFEVVGSPQGFDSSRGYDYAEQRVIEDRPRLQWLANELERLSFDLLFHYSFTSPATQLLLLRTTADAHQALPLVFGTGEFRGYYVIESITTKSIQFSAQGDPIAIIVRLALKEWVQDPVLNATVSPLPSFSPIGIVIAPTATGSSALTTGAASLAAASVPLLTTGVSPLLNNLGPLGPEGPSLLPDDVPTSVITRSVTL
ncbi:MAG TPA: phage tail protein [Candidatus Binataceae bacterium]